MSPEISEPKRDTEFPLGECWCGHDESAHDYSTSQMRSTRCRRDGCRCTGFFQKQEASDA